MMKSTLAVLGIAAVLVCLSFNEVESAPNPECQVGETKQVECNTCTCANGVFACTRKLCINDRSKRDAHIADELENTPCVPRDYFKIQCNTCYCPKNGGGFLCTRNICSGVGADFAEPYHTTIAPWDKDHVVVISSNKMRITPNDETFLNFNPDTWADRTSQMALNTPDFNSLSNGLSTNPSDNLGVGKAEPLEEGKSFSEDEITTKVEETTTPILVEVRQNVTTEN